MGIEQAIGFPVPRNRQAGPGTKKPDGSRVTTLIGFHRGIRFAPGLSAHRHGRSRSEPQAPPGNRHRNLSPSLPKIPDWGLFWP